jgi:hypothetical protein
MIAPASRESLLERIKEHDAEKLGFVRFDQSLHPPSSSRDVEKRRSRTRLKLDAEGRRALAAIRVSPEDSHLILANLALIRDVRNTPIPTREEGARGRPLIPLPDGELHVPGKIVRHVRRVSSLALGMAKRLEKNSQALEDLGVYRYPGAPIEELKRYARGLADWAEGVTVPVSEPRHRTHFGTEEIVSFVTYVQGITSRRHWKELSILVRLACNEQGMTADRLQKLCCYQKGKSRRRAHVPRGASQRRYL